MLINCRFPKNISISNSIICLVICNQVNCRRLLFSRSLCVLHMWPLRRLLIQCISCSGLIIWKWLTVWVLLKHQRGLLLYVHWRRWSLHYCVLRWDHEDTRGRRLLHHHCSRRNLYWLHHNGLSSRVGLSRNLWSVWTNRGRVHRCSVFLVNLLWVWMFMTVLVMLLVLVFVFVLSLFLFLALVAR